MNNIKLIALKFYILTERDQKLILQSLPDTIKKELLELINEIKSKGLNKEICASLLQSKVYLQVQDSPDNQWQFLLDKCEDHEKSGKAYPKNLFDTIKCIRVDHS